MPLTVQTKQENNGDVLPVHELHQQAYKIVLWFKWWPVTLSICYGYELMAQFLHPRFILHNNHTQGQSTIIKSLDTYIYIQ